MPLADVALAPRARTATSPAICFRGACQAGEEGDPCESELHCLFGNTCVVDTCYDGSEGDPCESNIDCDLGSDLLCTGTSTCG